jgi:hypothetical protein
LTGGKHKWIQAIGKGKRRNGLRLHTERLVMGFSNDDHREGEGRKAKQEKTEERECKIAQLECTEKENTT